MEEKGNKFIVKVMDKNKGKTHEETNCILTENHLIIEAELPIKIPVTRIDSWERHHWRPQVSGIPLTKQETTADRLYDSEEKRLGTITLTFYNDLNRKQQLSLEMDDLDLQRFADTLIVAVPTAKKEVWDSLPIEMKCADAGIRLFAAGVDSIIIGVILTILILILGWIFGLLLVIDIIIRLYYIELVFAMIYTVVFWGWRGQTPGKMLFRIKIVKTDGSPIDYGTALVRYIAYYVSGILLLIGFLWVLWDRRKQGLHDKIAGTVVIGLRP